MLAALLILAAVGLLGMTWLFPLTARAFYLKQLSRNPGLSTFKLPSLTPPPLSIGVLIPAHNEEAQIGETLKSIKRAVCRAKLSRNIDVRVTVGADGCTDRTAKISRREHAGVIESAAKQGKWKTVRGLIERSTDCNWLVVADAGAIWPADFLQQAEPLCRTAGIMAIAPAYSNLEGGLLERMIWSIERHFKRLEGLAGGPVSMHGATMLYRRTELCRALRKLGDSEWLNDDVVLPLMLRLENPGCRIHYAPEMLVFDRGAAKQTSRRSPQEFARRRRMLLGNIQWMKTFFPMVFASNQVAGILALRRVFRLFWAYWGLLLLVTAAMGVPAQLHLNTGSLPVLGLGLLLGCLLYKFSFSIRRVFAAAQASLLAPYYFLGGMSFKHLEWK